MGSLYTLFFLLYSQQKVTEVCPIKNCDVTNSHYANNRSLFYRLLIRLKVEYKKTFKISCSAKSCLINIYLKKFNFAQILSFFKYCIFYFSAIDGYAQSWMWKLVRFIACGDTNLEVYRGPPALSLVPDFFAPPNHCWPTTDPVD